MRRSNGEGQIGQRPNGTWFGAVQVGAQRRYVYGKTRAEVVNKLRELQHAVQTGRLVNASKLTVGEFLTDWLGSTASRLRPSTCESYQALIDCHVVPTLGGLKLQALKPLHLVRLYSDRARQRVSARRILMTHRVLHKAFGDAVKWQLLPANPVSDVEPPQWERAEQAVWTPQQAAQFLEHAQQYQRVYDPLWVFLLGSGCRMGEALGLRWSDVDLDGRTVQILRSMTFVKHRAVEGEPKTRSGTRALYLPAFAVDALRAHKRRQAGWRLRAGESWLGGDRVFTTQTGAPPTRNSLGKKFHAICRSAGVPELRVHGLRHVAATLLVASGTDVKTAQKRLGHSTAQVTLDVYAKALSASDRAAADGLDGILTRPSEREAAR